MAVKEIDQEEMTARRVVRKFMVGRSNYRLERAFEHAGCGCHLDREKLSTIEKEIQKERDKATAKYQKAYLVAQVKQNEAWQALQNAQKRFDGQVDTRWPEVPKLREAIEIIDREEHPDLDRQAIIAQPFLELWLLEQAKAGKFNPDWDASIKAFAYAWMQEGWRPFATAKQ